MEYGLSVSQSHFIFFQRNIPSLPQSQNFVNLPLLEFNGFTFLTSSKFSVDAMSFKRPPVNNFASIECNLFTKLIKQQLKKKLLKIKLTEGNDQILKFPKLVLNHNLHGNRKILRECMNVIQ